MTWKCCTLYTSSGHSSGKGQFSFQSQEGQCQWMFKLLHNCTYFTGKQSNTENSPKLGFNSTLTMNFQMFKPDLEKAEEPEIKLPTSVGSYKKRENSRKTSISVSLTTLKPLTVWITTNCGKFWKRWGYQTTWPASWEICRQVKNQH